MLQTDRSPRLRQYSSDTAVLAELSAYTRNAFRAEGQPSLSCNVLPQEPQVATWEQYVSEAQQNGVFETLKRYLVQLSFPVQAGISETDAYRQATRRGASTVDMPEARGLELLEPELLELFLYDSVAGKIPVIVANQREDFQSIVRALCYRNEPRPLPDSMGAAMVRGLNNWDRVGRLRQSWNTSLQGDWRTQKALFQDNLIILSRTPYSNVAATVLGLTAAEWLEQSLRIRLAHECAHYFTLRQFGTMASNMHDELIADYLGICEVREHFDPAWFLRFIGLESYPEIRPSGRLNNYLGNPPLSLEARQILAKLLVQAAEQVAIFDRQVDSVEDPNRSRRLAALCSFNLVELASEQGAELLNQAYHKKQHKNKLALHFLKED